MSSSCSIAGGILKIDDKDNNAVCNREASGSNIFFVALGPPNQPVRRLLSAGNCVHQVGISSSVNRKPVSSSNSFQKHVLNSNKNFMTAPNPSPCIATA